ncbi:MAG TPA: hypothetical protein VLC46_03735 [Thermoanaerobaculia bacterium]|jgi:hypothetical protein|nr:hypothetical protein [Thermoanaerobaculia bacterium]
MSTIRFAVVLSLLYGFAVIAYEGPIIDPNGGRRRAAVSSDQGGGLDPDGAVRKSSIAGDKGLGVDPNG